MKINFPKNLQAKRKSKSITQVEMANQLGISRSMLASYEQGVAEPSLCVLVKISNLLNVSADSLIKN